MKLVDILARELKAWPAGVHKLAQSFAGMVFYQDCAQQIVPLDRMEISDDFRYADVTLAEWQAAVDALNAPNVVEWDGVSLPPKGTAVEVRFACEKIGSEWPWHSGVVVASGPQPEGGAMVAVEANGFTVALRVTSDFIRPIRTAEQVAAEEIEAIREFLIYEHCDGGLIGIAKALHESGYRKEQKPCGS